MLVSQPFQNSGKDQIFFKILLLAHDPVASSGKFVRQRFSRHDDVGGF